METIFENDTLQFARRRIDLVAMGELCVLSHFSPSYAMDPMFGVVDQLIQHVETRTYAILYERAKKGDPISVPVGFVTWGNFSRSVELIHRERYRALRKDDLASGNKLFLLRASCPFGHKEELDHFFHSLHKSQKNIHRVEEGQVKTFVNPYWKE